MTRAHDEIGDGFDVRSLAVTYRDGYVQDKHTHPWAQLIYARAGIMHVTTDARVWFVPPTRAIWVPPLAKHQITAEGDVVLRTLYLSPRRTQQIDRPTETLEVSPLLGELVLHVLSKRMLCPSTPIDDHLASVLVDQIIAAPKLDLALPLPRDERAARLARHIRSSPDDKRQLVTVAAEMGASLRTLQRTFAAETGLTIEAWRQKARLVHSAAALAAGATVTAAALDCGYDSPSAYIAAFRKHFGVTPGQFGA